MEVSPSLPSPVLQKPLLEPAEPAMLDREYNPRLAVPDLGRIFERWAREGAAARAQYHPRVDLAYGTHERERLDYFPAVRATPGTHPPLCVFIHGGYWRACDKSDFSWVATGLLQRGFAVAVIGYGRIPASPLATLVTQAQRAHAWLHAHADELGFDRNRIVTAGHSAGGHLTAMMLATRWPEVDPSLPRLLVRGGLAISGLFELEPLRHAPFLRDDLQLDGPTAAQLSPARLEPAGGTRLITAVGAFESDAFKQQSRLLTDRWAGSFRRHIEIPDTHHYDVCDGFAHADSLLCMAVNELLDPD